MWAGFVRPMVRMTAGGIDVTERAARRHDRQRRINQGYEPGDK
jgi:hypothetical protein